MSSRQYETPKRTRSLQSDAEQNTPLQKRRAVEQTHNQPGQYQASGSSLSVRAPIYADGVNPSHLDASTHISHQDLTVNGGSVHIHQGSNIGNQVSKSPHILIQNMKRSHHAEYDVGEDTARGPCAPETRIPVLQTLDDWSIAESAPMLYWMSGIAGTGKSTVSFSFSDHLAGKNRLGASFFCSRSLPDCRDVNLILPTVAHQLAMKFPLFEESLAEILERNPDISKKNLDSQLRHLIIDPWNKSKDDLPDDVVVVLDALDECDDGHMSFLRVIFDNVANLPFKLFMTSRPEYSIRNAMNAKGSSILSTFILHDVEKDLVEADIASYLQHELGGHVPQDVIDELKTLSGSLFIVAATFVKLFPLDNIDSHERLESFKMSASTQTKALASLDELYQGVLNSAYGKLWDKEAQKIKDVLYTIVCAHEPLTHEALAGLLGITEQEVERRLESLHSVLSIPQDRRHPIVIFHASFPDFIQSISRSGRFYCFPNDFHLQMMECCLRVLKAQLCHNLSGRVTCPSAAQIDSGCIRSYISPALAYSAIYWVKHWILSNGRLDQRVLGEICNFLGPRGFEWIEHVSLLQRLPVAVQGLESVLNTIDNTTELGTIVYEYLRLIRLNYKGIEKDAMAIYSAFLFCPLLSPLRALHRCLPEKCPKILFGLSDHWPDLERVIRIGSAIRSIAIAENGNRMSVDTADGIYIWNIETHVEKRILAADTTCSVTAVSRDGSCIASYPYWSNALAIWNAETGEKIMAFNLSEKIYCLAMSPDGRQIAAGSDSGPLLIWDMSNGTRTHSLDGHTDAIKSLSFMPNTSYLVSGSDDYTCRVWNVLTGETKAIIRGHSSCVCSVACSPVDGRIATTGSWDNTARLWDITGQERLVLRGHTGKVKAVVFMPDGRRVATASDDATIRVWDVVAGNTIRVITTKSAVLPWQSLAVFPSGLIASCSRESGSIYLWSTRSLNISEPRPTGKSAALIDPKTESMCFSSDGRWTLLSPSLQILDTSTWKEKAVLRSRNSGYTFKALSATGKRAAIENYREIEVWELCDGEVTVGNPITLNGHSHHIHSISFSYDESLLVSASDDKTARVWNATTGQQIYVLNHTATCYSASFTRDGTQIMTFITSVWPSSSRDVYIWDAQTGAKVQQNHTNAYSSTFSPDGQHFHMLPYSTTRIYNTKTGKLEHEHKHFYNWTTLDNNTSYALSKDGWVCRFARFDAKPRRLLWIPPQYLPVDLRDTLTGCISPFLSSSRGILVFSAVAGNIVSILIPHGY